MKTTAFYRTVMEESGDRDLDVVKRATAAVFHALRDRLTPDEADQAVAQLPTELKDVWLEGQLVDWRPVKMHADEFFDRVSRDAGLDSRDAGRWMTIAVFAALQAQLSLGEAGDIEAQLPKDLKRIWIEASLGGAPRSMPAP